MNIASMHAYINDIVSSAGFTLKSLLKLLISELKNPQGLAAESK